LKKVKGQRYLFRRGEALVFRRGVPKQHRAAFGKSEVVVTLAASTIADACREMLGHLTQFEEQLGRTHAPEREPEQRSEVSLEDIEAGVREWFSDRQDRLANSWWPSPNRDDRNRRLAELRAYEEDAQRVIQESDPAALHSRWIAEAIAERNGWSLSHHSTGFKLLMRTVGRGQLEASRREREDLEGRPRASGDLTFAPEAYLRDQSPECTSSRKETLSGLFAGYAKERKPAPATLKAWQRQFTAFIRFLGHDDANRVTPEDVVAWKDHLLSTPSKRGSPLSAKTVNDTYLSVIRTIYRWAAENERVTRNPAAKVKVRAQRRVVTRAKGLTAEEARTILVNAIGPHPSRLSPERKFARRWVPWLCAYSGARVNEITQLRGEDVYVVEGIAVMRITPEAGSVKNHKARLVPLHPNLLDQGFLQAIDGKAGPLFYDPSRHRGGSKGNPQPKKVGEHLASWVRGLGIDHPDVQPNHGWRHRFKTEARTANMDREIRDAIQGHAPRTEGEAYGDFPPDVMLREIRKLPHYELGADVPQKRARAHARVRLVMHRE
jgi:integrase